MAFSAVFVAFMQMDRICLIFPRYSFTCFSILWFVKGYLRLILHMQVGPTDKDDVKVKGDLAAKCEHAVKHNDRARESLKLHTFVVETLV